MAAITGNAFIIKNGSLTLGANDYSALISQSELVPSTPTASFTAINGATQNLSGLASWVLTLAFGQDVETATSLTNYLFDNEGTTVDFTIVPNGGKGFKGKCVLAVGNIGGTSNAVASSSVSLQVIGKPTRITA